MDPSSLPKLSTLLTLGYGAAFALDLEQWSFGVVAGGSSVSFDAGFAGEGCFFSGVDGRVWERDERGTMRTSCR